jgi:hypothetical protein
MQLHPPPESTKAQQGDGPEPGRAARAWNPHRATVIEGYDAHPETDFAGFDLERPRATTLAEGKAVCDSIPQAVGFTSDGRIKSSLAPIGRWRTAPSTYVTTYLKSYPRHAYSGRGVVVTMGGEERFRLGWAAIRTLRTVGFTLPIEVVYSGDGELPAPARERLEALGGVTCLDAAAGLGLPETTLRGHPLKAAALFLSSFEDAILMSPDVFFYRDPTYLFDDPAYKRSGALFWHARENVRLSQIETRQFVESRFGLHNAHRYREQDGSCVVVDKEKSWRALQVLLGVNLDPETTYRFLEGDKDTFWLSCHLARTPYSFVPHGPGCVGVPRKRKPSNLRRLWS